MIKINKILFPADFSRCGGQALDHAIHLAERHGAELHMLHAIVLLQDDPHSPSHHFPDLEEIHARLVKLAESEMNKALKPRRTKGIKITMEQERGISAAETILGYAGDKDIDLIVMGTHGRRGLGHLLLGSVAEEVVRLARCPVLTVREREKPVGVKALERILVPVDFSEHSKAALAHARGLAAAYKAELQVLHVIEETIHPAFYVPGKKSIYDLRPDIRDRAEDAMRKLLDETPGPKVEAKFFCADGRAHRAILDFAEREKSGLIVIATHGLTGLQHLLLGSTAEKVVRRATCPVFTVKAFGKSLVG
jgi:nucleotide-binding universal stress UspA family protein